MNYDQETEKTAESQQHEALFVFGVLEVWDQQGIFVQEDRSRLFKRDAVPAAVLSRLSLIPFKLEAIHLSASIPTA